MTGEEVRAMLGRSTVLAALMYADMNIDDFTEFLANVQVAHGLRPDSPLLRKDFVATLVAEAGVAATDACMADAAAATVDQIHRATDGEP